MAHNTRIDGTGYEAKSGRTRIDGTGYSIKKGRTLIGGTGYDISFGTPVGELDVGTSVYMDVDGVRTEFLVVQQGKPDADVYDSTCDGTWLLAKNIYSTMYNSEKIFYLLWESTGVQTYLNSLIGLFDNWVQNVIKAVNFPNGLNANSITTTEYKITVPHPDEIEKDSSSQLAVLEYFKDQIISKRIANYNGEARRYYLRLTYASNSGNKFWYECSRTGSVAARLAESTATNGDNGDTGIRPLLVLPQDVMVDAEFCLMQS